MNLRMLLQDLGDDLIDPFEHLVANKLNALRNSRSGGGEVKVPNGHRVT